MNPKIRLIAIALSFAAGAIAQEGGLQPGQVEFSAFGGINFSPGRNLTPRTPPSVVIQGAVGLHRFVAFTAHYAYNDVGTYSTAHGNIEELMGGFRVSAVTESRVEPYGSFLVGVVRARLGADLGGIFGDTAQLNVSFTRFALGPDAGLNLRITHHVGMGFDFRAVSGRGLKWYFQPSIGIFVRI